MLEWVGGSRETLPNVIGLVGGSKKVFFGVTYYYAMTPYKIKLDDIYNSSLFIIHFSRHDCYHLPRFGDDGTNK